VIITRAVPADIETIIDWRRERVAWLGQLGEDQWSIPLPRSAVAATVMAGQTWMVWEGPTPLATMTLTAFVDFEDLWKPDPDPEALWHPEDDPADALYVAKMIVPMAYAGRGLGGEMLDWAFGRAFDAGLTWLRLDAWTTNTRLHNYYRGQGFRHVRTVGTRVSGACFQRPSQPYIGGRLKTEE
jgi:ribosomal protein S18 acetylase RimI-like enzyme